MEFPLSQSLSVLYLLSSILLAFVVGGVYFAVRAIKSHSVSACIASILFFAQSIGILGILLTSIKTVNVSAPFSIVLGIFPVITGFVPLFAILLFLIELKRPGFLNWNRIAVIISPFLLASICLLCVSGNCTPIMGRGEIMDNIGRFDVLLRVIILILYVIYAFATVLLTGKCQSRIVSKSFLFIFQTVILIVPFTFIFSLNLCFFSLLPVHTVLLLALNAMIVYIEVFAQKTIEPTDLPKQSELLREENESSVQSRFDDPEIWMDPDMTAVKLAKIVGTNQKYLSEMIKSMGFSSYNDMINRKRVKYVCQQLSVIPQDENVNITVLFSDAGFRSRSTANGEFKRIMGCTPSEYKKSIFNKETS